MDALITHTFIEFFYNGGQGLLLNEQLFKGEDRIRLFEAYGVFDGCEETADKLADMIINLSPVKNIKLNNADLDFLKEINIIIKDDMNAFAAYSSDETVVGENGFFDSISIYVKSSIANKYYELLVFLMHELTHAKQDHDLRLKCSSIKQETNKIGYYKHTDILPDANDLEKNLAKLLYYLNQYEKGAYVTMLRGECEKVKDKVFKDIGEAISFLKTTGPYNTYHIIQILAEYYGNTNQSSSEKEKIMVALRKISNYNFSSFNDFSKWAKTRANKVLRKMDDVIPKMACEYLTISSSMAPARYLTEADIYPLPTGISFS